MTALVAATNKIKGGVWFMFGLVTFIQMIGNIFFSYKEIDADGELFKSWVELTSPIWEFLGSDVTDVVSLKRWLAFLEGGLLPIISLTSLHFFIKYEDNKEKIITPEPEKDSTKDILKDIVTELKKEETLNQTNEEEKYFQEEMFFSEETTETTTEKIEVENTTTTTTENSRRLVYTKET